MKNNLKLISVFLFFYFSMQSGVFADRLIFFDDTNVRVIVLDEDESEIKVLLSSGELIYEKNKIKQIIRETPEENEVLRSIFESAERRYIEQLMVSPWPRINIVSGQTKKVRTAVIEGYDFELYFPRSYNEGLSLAVFYLIGSDNNQLDDFKNISEELGVILVFINTGNRTNLAKLMGQVYAVILDASFRLPIDPSGQYVVGLLDDTEIAFTSERWFSQQIAGIYCASGHLGGIKDAWPQYRETLLVARAYGCYDKTLERQLVNDKEYLDSHELIIKDWIFKGGHTLPPRETNEEVFLWLLENRKTALQIDMRLAQELSVKWQQDYNLGQGAYVFEECLRTELNNPCTWQAYQARKMLYELLDNYNLFSKYDLKNIKYSREVENYFCQIAYASILSADVKRLKSSLQILNEIGIKDSVWAANLSLAFMVSPHKETQSIRTACSIIERAMLFNKKDSSLKLIGAAICIKNGDYEGANKMYKRISNKKLTSKEKVALCEIAASIAEKKDKLNMYSFYKIMRF